MEKLGFGGVQQRGTVASNLTLHALLPTSAICCGGREEEGRKGGREEGRKEEREGGRKRGRKRGREERREGREGKLHYAVCISTH